MARRSPFILLGAVLLLLVLGFVMLVSVGPYTPDGASNPNAEALKQALFAGLGVAALLAAVFIDYRSYARWSPWIYVLAIIALGLCFAPEIGVVKNGSRRWLRVGPAILQPSEFAKIAVIIYLAAVCAKSSEFRRTFLRGFALPLGAILVPVILIGVETDLGNASLLALGSLAVLYAGGVRLRFFVPLIGLAAVGLAAVIMHNSERFGRIMAFMDLEKHKSGDGLQQWLSLTALGSGGEWGLGIGNSRQKMWSLPYPNSDFISSIIGEELGLWMCLCMVFCYVCFTIAGITISTHAPDRFGKLLGFGLVTVIAFQAIIHLGVTTALLPNKGMPLPFISAGGSNLVCLLLSVGILLNIYRQARHLDYECDPVLRRRKITPPL